MCVCYINILEHSVEFNLEMEAVKLRFSEMHERWAGTCNIYIYIRYVVGTE